MTQIGEIGLPGVQANIDSDRSFSIADGAPDDVGLVGEADLSNGTAEANTVYEINTQGEAKERFGARSDSQLTKNVQDALQVGAYPVYACATEEKTATDDLQDLSGTSGNLDNSPIKPDASTVTFKIDGTSKSTVFTLDDPSTKSPGTDEVYINHVNGKYEVDAAPSDGTDNDTAEYTHFDYTSAIQAMGDQEGETIDILASVTEETSSVEALKDEVLRLEDNFNLALGLAGAGLNIVTADYSNPFDTSRMQLLYPTRTDSGDSIIGAYAGLRATLGISESTMRKRIRFLDSVRKTLTESDKKNMDAENVVPVENRSPGVRFRSDPTCVSDENTDEQNMRDGLSRLIVDAITMVVHEVSEDFIGKLHSEDNRNAMRAIISKRLSELVERNAVEAYTISVTEQDAYTADVNVGVETVKPLRNVIANVTAGEVE